MGFNSGFKGLIKLFAGEIQENYPIPKIEMFPAN